MMALPLSMRVLALVHLVVSCSEDDYSIRVDMMDEMFEVIQLEFTEDPLTVNVELFFKLLKSLEESLHKHTEVIILAFMT
jgi:hypothetical protein